MENVKLSIITKRNDDTIIRVCKDGEIVGYIHRTAYEVTARRVFYPCTTTKIVWHGRKCDGSYTEYKTRKAAVAAIITE